MLYTYYLTNRPPDIGTYPNNGNIASMEAFSHREYVQSIERYAWGWVSYTEPLTDKEVKDYELVQL